MSGARPGGKTGRGAIDPERLRSLLIPGIAVLVVVAVAVVTMGLLTGDLPLLVRRPVGGVAGPA